MALPGGANRIDDAVSAVVLSLSVGARTPRANCINEWSVPNPPILSIYKPMAHKLAKQASIKLISGFRSFCGGFRTAAAR